MYRNIDNIALVLYEKYNPIPSSVNTKHGGLREML